MGTSGGDDFCWCGHSRYTHDMTYFTCGRCNCRGYSPRRIWRALRRFLGI